MVPGPDKVLQSGHQEGEEEMGDLYHLWGEYIKFHTIFQVSDLMPTYLSVKPFDQFHSLLLKKNYNLCHCWHCQEISEV